MEILDDLAIIAQRDPRDALGTAAEEWQQLNFELPVEHTPRVTPKITGVVVAGMGGSALAAGVAVDWLRLPLPFVVVRDYSLPEWVDEHTLVIASSYSGNTEETLSALQQASEKGAITAVLASGGKLLEIAKTDQLPNIKLPESLKTTIRMALMAQLNGLMMILTAFGVAPEEKLTEYKALGPWLKDQTSRWLQSVPATDNPAKQLAWQAMGKTPVVYASGQFRSLAYKWKISFNENAKNIAFWNEYSEFNHNEFIGWTSHPVEKPFFVLDLRSSLDHPQIQKRFDISDRLLSGMRPKAISIQLEGETILHQLLWGAVLADFTTIYLAVLNGVDSTDMTLIERLKKDLV